MENKISKKARRFQLTLNQIEKWPELLEYLKSLKTLGYLLACKEIAPETGHEHIHCYVQFESPITLSLKKTQGAHIESCIGTPQANIDYIKKDGNIICELGNFKKQGRFNFR